MMEKLKAAQTIIPAAAASTGAGDLRKVREYCGTYVPLEDGYCMPYIAAVLMCALISMEICISCTWQQLHKMASQGYDSFYLSLCRFC